MTIGVRGSGTSIDDQHAGWHGRERCQLSRHLGGGVAALTTATTQARP